MNAFAYVNDSQDYEVIDGQVYMMSSPNVNHVRVNGNLHNIFSGYLKGKRCESFTEFNVFFDDDNYFIPDEIIVCDPEIVEDDGIHGTPDLVVEIASPSTARRDRMEKFKLYEKYGVKEYWIVSPEAKSVEVYLLNNGKLELDNVYTVYRDFEWKALTEEQKAAVKHAIKVSLYDDFEVKLADIFERVK